MNYTLIGNYATTKIGIFFFQHAGIQNNTEILLLVLTVKEILMYVYLELIYSTVIKAIKDDVYKFVSY